MQFVNCTDKKTETESSQKDISPSPSGKSLSDTEDEDSESCRAVNEHSLSSIPSFFDEIERILDVCSEHVRNADGLEFQYREMCALLEEQKQNMDVMNSFNEFIQVLSNVLKPVDPIKCTDELNNIENHVSNNVCCDMAFPIIRIFLMEITSFISNIYAENRKLCTQVQEENQALKRNLSVLQNEYKVATNKLLSIDSCINDNSNKCQQPAQNRSQGHKIMQRVQDIIIERSPNTSPHRKAISTYSTSASPIRQLRPVQPFFPAQQHFIPFETLQMQSRINALTKENALLKTQLGNLSQKKCELSDVLNFIDNASMPNVTQVGRVILKDLINCSLCKAKGRRYTTETKEFAFILNCKSAKCYSILPYYLPLPALNTIKNEFKNQETTTASALLDTDKIQGIIDEFYKIHCTDVIRATLAVDAISINQNYKTELKSSIGAVSHKIDKQYEFYRKNLTKEQREAFDTSEELPINSAFIFYLEPHDPNIPCTPVHIFLKHGGNANKPVQALVNMVIERINASHKIEVNNFSSDGDLGYQFLYDK